MTEFLYQITSYISFLSFAILALFLKPQILENVEEYRHYHSIHVSIYSSKSTLHHYHGQLKTIHHIESILLCRRCHNYRTLVLYSI